jgi:excinuclease ABC subunit C
MIRQQLTKLKLPDNPGVYTFVDVKGRPLYIGRATSLKDRVKSYFSLDLIDTRGPRIVDMITRAKTVRWQETDSVLEAIILESNLIKRYQPYYNVDERDDKSSQYVVITDEPWPRVFLVRARDYDQDRGGTSAAKRVFGPYPHGGLIKEALKILRKMFPFKDKKSLDARHDAFYRALGRSPQYDDLNARRRYQRTIENLILFFEGKKDLVRRRIEQDMIAYAKKMRFEEANLCKKTLYALDHINDMALIKTQIPTFAPPSPLLRETLRKSEAKATEGHSKASAGKQDSVKGKSGSFSKGFRMEAYDIAHLSGTNVVGAFTVSVDGEFIPAEYRKFKISRQTNDDIAGLMEIISRRLNHPEWAYPDLIIVDGNETHVTHAEAVLKVRRISIPVIGVAKDDRHKAARLIGNFGIISRYQKEIVALNAEVHRYVIRYHRQKRGLELFR